jgi:hypothetical protein
MRTKSDAKYAVVAVVMATAAWTFGRAIVRAFHHRDPSALRYKRGQSELFSLQGYGAGSESVLVNDVDGSVKNSLIKKYQSIQFEKLKHDAATISLMTKGVVVDNRDGKRGPYALKDKDADPSGGECEAILKHLNGKVSHKHFVFIFSFIKFKKKNY